MNAGKKFPRKYIYYKILAVEKTASFDVIKKSYRILAKKFFPDLNPDPKANEIMKTINEAYEVLSNPSKRSLYDNSEVECPKCWTYEVTRISNDNSTDYKWKCKRGHVFQFIEYKKSEKINRPEKPLTYPKFDCPKCHRGLSFDTFILLYRCKNNKCLRVFTYKELCKHYGITPDSIHTTNEIKEKPFTKDKDISLSRVALVTLLVTAIICIVMLYGVFVNFSQICLGLFLFLFAFSMLSYWVYKNPKKMNKIIKTLTVKK